MTDTLFERYYALKARRPRRDKSIFEYDTWNIRLRNGKRMRRLLYEASTYANSKLHVSIWNILTEHQRLTVNFNLIRRPRKESAYACAMTFRREPREDDPG